MDYFFLIDRHLDPMMAIVTALGDEKANAPVALPGANTAYQLVFHCCGMLEWWTRESMLGVPVGRDRAAEFDAAGTVEQLRARVEQVKEQLRADLPAIDPDARPRAVADYAGTPIAESARGAMWHVLEELAQHHGHLEITRDLLLPPPS